jgi:hypothetical protein
MGSDNFLAGQKTKILIGEIDKLLLANISFGSRSEDGTPSIIPDLWPLYSAFALNRLDTTLLVASWQARRPFAFNDINKLALAKMSLECNDCGPVFMQTTRSAGLCFGCAERITRRFFGLFWKMILELAPGYT